MSFLVRVCVWLWRVEFADFTGRSDLLRWSLVSLEGSTAADTSASPKASGSSEEPSF